MKPLLAPSMLSADFLHLEEDVRFVNEYGDLFHLDIMDGTLVPNISFGFPIVEAIAKLSQKPLDAHLMIVNPWKYFERFAKVGINMLSFHYEAARLEGEDCSVHLKRIKELGMKAGLVINPDIPVKEIFPYLQDADFVLIMSVFAGFGGQKFITDTYDRLRELKNEIDSRGLDCMIEVDGGVSPDNAGKLVDCGAEILVAGSSVFNAKDRVEAAGLIKSPYKI